MTWEYALIGLVVGIIIGAVAMRFGSSKLQQQQALQSELEKSKAELETYRRELVVILPQRQFVGQHGKRLLSVVPIYDKSSSNLLADLPMQDNLFRYRLTEAEAANADQVPVSMPPRDYSDSASGLLRGEHPLRK
ncbi:MAG: ZapG family protein [Symbiopectobacterium sp.]